MNAPPFVSVIVPCVNERGHIARTLDSILATEYPKDHMEVLVADGMSTDGTREILQEYRKRHPILRMLDNPRKTTPCALNLCVAAAKGDVIVRMDVHTEYPPAYIPMLVNQLDRSGADNVGGVCITKPSSNSAVARAIACALSHRFGVGNSHFRVGSEEPRWVDTVPFGCFRRSVFSRIGTFDEDLPRNQDDEFNHRLIRSGGRILLVPEIVSYYYPRSSLGKLWRMYYQYGYFKPLAARKVGRVMTARQLAPALFLLGLLGSAAAGAFWKPALIASGALAASYAVTATVLALAESVRARAAHPLLLPVVFPVLHFSYGLGYIKGLMDVFVFKRPPPRSADQSPPTR